MVMKNDFIDRLNKHVLIGDGAMGTMLYQYGVFINTCFDELNLTNSKLIEKVHNAYIEAGADFVETNTFGANSLKLAMHGLADKVTEINSTAAAIARGAVAESKVLVAGSVGPLGHELPPYGRLNKQQAYDAFTQQIQALVAGKVDFLLLETFADPNQLEIAINAASAITELPIVAQLTTNSQNETPFGQQIDHAITKIADMESVVAVGLNCSVGPLLMLDSIELISHVTDKPISAQPNAGLPREIDGRMIYMSTPEYMAEYAKKFFEKGVRIIGGCCGTTPQHIKETARAVRALDSAASQKPTITVTTVSKIHRRDKKEPAAAAIPLAQKSTFGKKLATGDMVTTIEVTPPRGADLSGIIEKARLCAKHGIDAINIPDGPRASSRISPMVTAVQIQNNANIEAILHVCCRDRNIIGMQSDMLGAQAIGLRNMLLITGDPPKLGEYPDATAVYDLDSIGLTAVVHNLNCGIDIGGNEFSRPLSLTLGVGANPVAADINREIDRFKQKVDAGAEYAITQPVFDPEMLLRFLEATQSHKIPIVAGIWPFTSYKNAEFMANEVPGVVVPKKQLEKMSKTKTREEGRKLGIKIAREMVETIKKYVAGFAVSAPFGNVNIALAVLDKIDIDDI